MRTAIAAATDDFVTGKFEYVPRGFGFIRTGTPQTDRVLKQPDGSEVPYCAADDDIYVSPAQIRQFDLKPGFTVKTEWRKPQFSSELGRKETFRAVSRIVEINGRPVN